VVLCCLLQPKRLPRLTQAVMPSKSEGYETNIPQSNPHCVGGRCVRRVFEKRSPLLYRLDERDHNCADRFGALSGFTSQLHLSVSRALGRARPRVSRPEESGTLANFHRGLYDLYTWPLSFMRPRPHLGGWNGVLPRSWGVRYGHWSGCQSLLEIPT